MLSAKIHRYIFLFAVCSGALGMMLGAAPTSIPQAILVGNWLLELDFKRKWEQLKSNKLFWAIIAIYLVHLLGLIYSSDLHDGIKDIKTKSPLLLLPMVFFSTKPLTKKEFHFVLECFLLGSLLNVVWCYIYTFVLHNNEVVRSASRFMSHIRLGLYLNVAVSVCVYFIVVQKGLVKKLSYIILILTYIFGMYSLGLASGIANLCILSFLAAIYLVFKQDLKVKLITVTILIAGIYFVVNYIKGVYNEQIVIKDIPYNKMQEKNKFGVAYIHLDTIGKQKENGNLIHINLDLYGLKKEWNRRCPSDTFSFDPKHNLTRFEILIRYLTSKELTKDSAGVRALTSTDLAKIKRNKVNYISDKWSYLHKRVYEMVYEYDEFVNDRNINGHSLSMRPFFWKAALNIIKHNPIMGVGTGDVQNEMNKSYIETHSPLSKEWYKRPHNQFLTITAALGVIGLIVFCISLFLPVFRLRKHLHVLFWSFFYLALSSFLLEDTLESQAGLAFFAFFNTLFISCAYYNRHSDLADPADK